ncbi:hypothetical protein AB8880_06730 [Alphaproteobacteria bacterium LSUCC0684]
MADPPTDKDTAGPSRKRWLKHLGVGAFLFFLFKGIAWLVVAGLAVWGFWG